MKKEDLDRLKVKLAGFNVDPVPIAVDAEGGDEGLAVLAVAGPASPADRVYLYYTVTEEVIGSKDSRHDHGGDDGDGVRPVGARGEPLNSHTKVKPCKECAFDRAVL